ncbi:MAG: hypothetical protein M0P47_11630 [Bacteroidales bacterium]|nr:hypothetical protein [Bacteroidales bacterium]
MKPIYWICICSSLIISISGCKKTHNDDPVYYTTSFTVKNSANLYKTTGCFNRFCIMSGVCNTFYLNPSEISTNYLNLGFPKAVKTGDTFTQETWGTHLLYTDNLGHQYFSSAYDTLNIHIDVWEGHAGWAKGTFSGKLKYTDPVYGLDSVYITNGTFTSKIWYTLQ